MVEMCSTAPRHRNNCYAGLLLLISRLASERLECWVEEIYSDSEIRCCPHRPLSCGCKPSSRSRSLLRVVEGRKGTTTYEVSFA